VCAQREGKEHEGSGEDADQPLCGHIVLPFGFVEFDSPLYTPGGI
jgi:hypothetical protein